jgi:hypothetical protein
MEVDAHLATEILAVLNVQRQLCPAATSGRSSFTDTLRTTPRFWVSDLDDQHRHRVSSDETDRGDPVILSHGVSDSQGRLQADPAERGDVDIRW